MPTIRGQPWRDVAHPQTSRLVTAGASQQQQQRQQHGYDDGLATDLFSSDKLHQTHGSTVSPAAASCSDADASAAFTCPMQPINIAGEQASVTAANQQEAEAELTLACQQLAEAAAKHAKQRAVLEQALLAPVDLTLSSAHLQAPDAALPAPADCTSHETDCPAACGEPLEAASVSNRQVIAALDAAPVDQVQEGGASCLTAACRELAHVASAHAAQRAQLDSLVQCQLAPATTMPAHANHAASKTSDCAMHQHIRSTRRLTAAAKGKALGKVGGKHKQACSAVDTAAWPPGPQQHIWAGQDHPSDSRDSNRRRSNSVKAAESTESHADSPMLVTPTAEASGRGADLLAPDAHSCGLTLPMADKGSAEQWPPAAAMPGGLSARQGCLHSADADSVLNTQGILQSPCQMPISSAGMLAAGTVAADLCFPDSRVCIAGQASVSKAEPSFGTVHGMLSALQLPNLGLLLPSHSTGADVDPLGILVPVEEFLADDTAGQTQLAVVQQPPGGHPYTCFWPY